MCQVCGFGVGGTEYLSLAETRSSGYGGARSPGKGCLVVQQQQQHAPLQLRVAREMRTRKTKPIIYRNRAWVVNGETLACFAQKAFI